MMYSDVFATFDHLPYEPTLVASLHLPSTSISSSGTSRIRICQSPFNWAKRATRSAASALDIKLECDKSGRFTATTVSKSLQEEENKMGFLCCDLAGCYFADEPASEATFKVLEGEGWRLGYDNAPQVEVSFCAVVGPGEWSLALTASEFNDFCSSTRP